MKYVVLIFFVFLAACKTSERLATCRGEPFQLNAAQWQPAPEDLQVNCAKEPQ
ncbi:type IV secretion system lipoprotein VirB7 [Mesorhizobium abyssinicae]|uniref:type IV secretion system lipoprotein VirB7 n=1 Tax=Mesorhizobium abyssinicae TaxID=1209958 RepID=UPI003396A442